MGTPGKIPPQLICTHVAVDRKITPEEPGPDIIILIISFPNRKSDGTVREFCTDLTDQSRHSFSAKPHIFAPLQHKGAETKTVSISAAGKNIFLRQSVTGNTVIASADPAVITIVSAIIGKFDQTTDIDIFSIMSMTYFSRPFKQKFR